MVLLDLVVLKFIKSKKKIIWQTQLCVVLVVYLSFAQKCL